MWNPVDTQFFGPKTPVGIACVHDSEGAHILRNVAEGFQTVTHYYSIGCPTDFLKVLAQEETAPPYLLVSGHGGDHGINFGTYADGIDTSSLIEEDMPATSIAQHVKLPGTMIINTTCDGGSNDMAQAFLSGGALAYIGCTSNPLSIEHPLFVAHFFHSISRKKLSPYEAWEKAAAYDDQSRRYLYFDQKGRKYLNSEFSLVEETWDALK